MNRSPLSVVPRSPLPSPAAPSQTSPTAFSRPPVSRRFLRHGMLPHLAAFEAVVRIGNATRAAETLCMAQPTLSGHLRKLEESLDVRLFETRGRHLVPTEVARHVLDAAYDVFEALERCEVALQQARAQPEPRLDLSYGRPRQRID